jgi:acetyl-CoA acetyltransferase
VVTRKGAVLVEQDEQPMKADPAKIPTLKPAFSKDGTITAANASSISDGAAALVMTRESVAKRLGMTIVARVAGHAAHAHEPGLFTTAPVPAIQKALKRAGWSVDDVDLFEVNEAFAVVAMIAERDLGIDRPSSTSTAAPARSAIPSAPRAPGSWRPCSRPSKPAAASAASPASASAAAKRRRWRWSWPSPNRPLFPLSPG